MAESDKQPAAPTTLAGQMEEILRDSDKDGLSDAAERSRGTGILDADSDEDGILDGAEVDAGLNPKLKDTDKDGLDDGVERKYGSDPRKIDTDGDGRSDSQEREDETDPRNWDLKPAVIVGRQTDKDSDHDGVSDEWERTIGTDPNTKDTTDALQRISDSDKDGLSDWAELNIGTNPFDEDTDHDGVDDLTEINRKTNPKDGYYDDPPEPAPEKTPMRLPDEPPKRPVELTQVRDDATIEDFLRNVLAQQGDKYKLGAVASLRDDDPDVWDGSELVEWAANRAGSMINDGAANQYKQLARHKGELSVETAMSTPGALLYEFDKDPLGKAGPTRASTAISLGDGKHIIDIDPVHGVRIIEATDFTFTHAGVMPGFVDSHDPGPDAHALVQQALVDAGIAVEPPTAPADAPPADGQPTDGSDATTPSDVHDGSDSEDSDDSDATTGEERIAATRATAADDDLVGASLVGRSAADASMDPLVEPDSSNAAIDPLVEPDTSDAAIDPLVEPDPSDAMAMVDANAPELGADDSYGLDQMFEGVGSSWPDDSTPEDLASEDLASDS